MLRVDKQFERAFATLGLHSCEAVVEFFTRGESPPEKNVWIKTATLPVDDPVPVFYKQYQHAPRSWRFLGRESKARREFENYGVFTQLGVPCAQRIACGESRDALGRLRHAFIVTRAIPDATDLAVFLQQQAVNRSATQTRIHRAAIGRELAAVTRRIHDAGFFHRDLVWRNVLVTGNPFGDPKLWWIDCPRGRFIPLPFLHRRNRIKDLASLDKSAARFCTRGERIQFVKHYLGKSRLDAGAKQLIRDTQAYRRARWPEDWEKE